MLITGATGYIGGVVAASALAAGYRVRATVRDAANRTKLESLRALSGPDGRKIDIVSAELDKADGWAAAVAGASFVLHVASPVPVGVIKDEECEVIQPAILGNTHVLAAVAAEPSVKRVVIVSSLSAVSEGRQREYPTHVFNEADWSDLTAPGVSAYAVSKTRAERAAWEFMAAAPRSFTLTTLCPGFVIGPAATTGEGSSTQLYIRFFTWGMPAIPDLQFACVDVRDVALAALRAMLTPAAAGQRYVIANTNYAVRDLAADLRAELGPAGISLPSLPLPSWVLRGLSFFDRPLRIVTPMLGIVCRYDHTKAERELRISFRDTKAASIGFAYSLLARGVVPDGSKGAAISRSAVPLEHWLSYAAAPKGASAAEAARYLLSSDDLADVAWSGGAGGGV